MDPLNVYIAARDRHGLSNSAVAQISTDAGEPIDLKSVTHWCENGTGRTAWLTVTRALAVVGIGVDMKPIKGFRPATPRKAGRPKVEVQK